MKYTVIDAPAIMTDRAHATALCEQLQAKEPDKNYMVAMAVSDIQDHEPMEMLYSAVTALAEITGVNPFSMELHITSTGERRSLYRVIEDAREWLDAMEVKQ